MLPKIVVAAALGGSWAYLAEPAWAQKDPDWPCVQPLVATLTTGAYWSGAPAAGDWRADPKVAAIVASAAPRRTPIDDALRQISAFADSVPPAARPDTLAEVFQGLVDETNVERARLIVRIKEQARRQRMLSRSVTDLASEWRAAPADSPQAADIQQRRDFATRAFQEAQRTIRYACEIPASLDARLGQFARTLQERLGG